MTRTEIVAQLAKDRLVEQVVRRITRLPEDCDDSHDLCQYLYLVLLEYNEDKLRERMAKGDIDNLIARLVVNNFRSAKSRFHYLFRVFRERSVSLAGMDFPDKPQEL